MSKVSVIIPVYNVESYLEECLNSITNQTLSDIEIICVDDGSTDNSLNILNKYAQKDDRVKVLTQNNQGAGTTRNTGLNIATGEYLYFLDSDDFIDKTALEKAFNKIQNTNADICIFKNNRFLTDKNTYLPCNWENLLQKVPPKETFNRNDVTDLFMICNVPAFTKLYNHEFIKKNNIQFQEVKTCNDVFFNLITLALADSITVLDETLVTYRTQHQNLSSSRDKHIECILLAMKKLKQELIARNLFPQLEYTFYQKSKEAFTYELGRIQDNLLKEIFWTVKLFKFIPRKYRNPELQKLESKQLKKIFSLTNTEDKTHKVLTVLGLPIYIKRKGQNA